MRKLGKDVKQDSKYSGRKRGLIRLLKWFLFQKKKNISIA